MQIAYLSSSGVGARSWLTFRAGAWARASVRRAVHISDLNADRVGVPRRVSRRPDDRESSNDASSRSHAGSLRHHPRDIVTEYRSLEGQVSSQKRIANGTGLRYRAAPLPAPPAEKGVKAKKAPKPKPVYPWTMNGSGLAVGRALVAVLENHQRDARIARERILTTTLLYGGIYHIPSTETPASF